MRTSVYLAAAILATSLAVAPLSAQRTADSRLPLLQVTPYAGYYAAGKLAEGPLGTHITSGSGPLYGAQLAVPVTGWLSVVGNVAYAKGDLRVGAPIVGGFSAGDATTWMYDGGVQLNAPPLSRSGTSLTPFAQIGAGAARHAIDISSLQSRSTNFAWNAGLGVDVALGQSVGIRLLAKDYMGKFDVQEATGFDLETKSIDNWSFVAGISFGF